MNRETYLPRDIRRDGLLKMGKLRQREAAAGRFDSVTLPKRIDQLKRQAKAAYQSHQRELDSFGDTCGANLAAIIRPSIYAAARNYNIAMAELKKLDPACPDYTPLPEGK